MPSTKPIPLDRILTVIEPAKQLRLVILDACRDNPFRKTMKHNVASRGVGRGLAKVEPDSPNTMIAFAAKAGSTATDGDDKNSPFTAALVKYLPRPGLDLRKAFGFVRDDVLKSTRNRQEPFIYGSLGGDDVALVPASGGAARRERPPTLRPRRRDYELAQQINVVVGLGCLCRQISSGFYTDLAKAAARQARRGEGRRGRRGTARRREKSAGRNRGRRGRARKGGRASQGRARRQDRRRESQGRRRRQSCQRARGLRKAEGDRGSQGRRTDASDRASCTRARAAEEAKAAEAKARRKRRLRS